MERTLQGRPVIFGEVLFDTFESGESMLGGAPFNVAWHLQGFGLQPFFISRVGKDHNGKRILQMMEKWGMDCSGMQKDDKRATGRVEVEVEEISRNPTYHIIPNRAYDYIDKDEVESCLEDKDISLLYHGTLIQRLSPEKQSEPVSRDALEYVRQKHIPKFVSLNLRPPWWDLSSVHKLLEGVSWCKLNEPELAAIVGRTTVTPPEREDLALEFLNQFDLELVIVTLGAEGALFAVDGKVMYGTPGIIQTGGDTVGAGDAFAAVTVMGICSGWPLPVTLQRAIDFSADLCGWSGATPTSKTLYSSHIHRWKQSENLSKNI